MAKQSKHVRKNLTSNKIVRANKVNMYTDVLKGLALGKQLANTFQLQFITMILKLFQLLNKIINQEVNHKMKI